MWGISLSLLMLIGCGGSEGPESAGGKSTAPGKGQKDGTEQTADAKAEAAKRLASMTMAEELKAELFYEGDGKYELSATYDPATGKVTYALSKLTQATGKKGKQAETWTPVKEGYAGIYQSDRIQGPYKLVGRFQGPATALPEEVSLENVRGTYWRAVVYDAEGKQESITDPVAPEIKAPVERKATSTRSTAAPARESTKAKGKAAEAAPSKEKAPETAKAAAPVKTAVLIFLDQSTTMPAEYLEKNITEEVTKALAACPGLEMCRRDLVAYAVEQRRVTLRDVLKPVNMKNVSRLLDAEKLVFGGFWLDKDKVRLTATVAETNSDAQYMVVDVTKDLSHADELAADLLKGIGENLGVQFPEEVQKALGERMKVLAEETVKVAEVRKHLADLDFKGAIALFEQLPAQDMRDPGFLSQMAQAYGEMANNRRKAEMTVGSIKAGPGLKKPEDVDRLVGVLEEVGDLSTELNLLAEVTLPEKTNEWDVARELMKEATGKSEEVRPSRKAAAKRTWPLIRPSLKIQAERVLLNPTRLGDALIVFSSADPETLRSFGEVSLHKGKGGLAEMKVFEADRFTTTAYRADGTVQWSKDGLMTPTVQPVSDGELMYGVRGGVLVAVRLENGEVKWESQDKPLTLPDKRQGVETDRSRPWWRTWELRIVGSYLVAWDPDGNELHSFRKADGSHAGVAKFQRLGDVQERMLIEKGGKLFYMERGQGTLRELTEQDLSNPIGLQTHLTLGANNDCTVEDGTVYQLRERFANRKGAGGDKLYYGVASKADSGEFSWMQMLSGTETPVLCKGKLYRLKTPEPRKISSVVEVVDPKAEELKSVDLTELMLDDVTPRMAISNGTVLLLGNQVALSLSDYSVLWVNPRLSNSYRPALVGDKVIGVGPLLAQAANGTILGEMDAGEGFDWGEAVENVVGDKIIVCGNSVLIKGLNVTARGCLLEFMPELTQLAVIKEEQAAAVARRGSLSPDKVEEAVWQSRVVPQPGLQRWEVQELVARWKFQAKSKPEDAIEYLTGLAGQKARTAEGPFELVKLTRPYAVLSGKMGPYLASLEKLEKDYPSSRIAGTLQAEKDSAQGEINREEKAKKTLEVLRASKDDPTRDYPSARGTAGMIGSAGEGVTPPFKPKWAVKVGNSAETGSLIMAVDDKVLVLTMKPGTLKVVAAADGKPAWEAPQALGAAVYHGIVYVLGDQLEAREFASGLVLWQAPLPSEVQRSACAIAAGKEMCVISTGHEVVSFGWDTGKQSWRQELPGCDRLEIQGDYVVAGIGEDNMVNVLEAQTGKPLWNKEFASYALYDGYLYGVRKGRAAPGGQEIRFERYVLFAETPDGSVSLVLPIRGSVKRVPSPVIANGTLLMAFAGNLVAMGTDGTVKWKHELPQYLVTDMTASPTTVYVGLDNGDLVGFDLTKPEGAETVRLAQMGVAPGAMGKGVLYVLRRGDLMAWEGAPAPYLQDYLAKVWTPAKRVPKMATPGTVASAKVRVKTEQFIKGSRITSIGGLVLALENPDTMAPAFEVMLDFGGVEVLRGPAEKYLLTPPIFHAGKQTMSYENQPLGLEQAKTLTDELVERKVVEAVPVLVQAVAGRTQALAEPVSEALKDADPLVYGPGVLAQCKQAVEVVEWGLHRPAVNLFGAWKYQPAIPFLTEQVLNKKNDINIRLNCVQALGMYDSGRTNTELTRLMNTKDIEIRLVKAVAEVLAAGGEPGLKSLSNILSSSAATMEARTTAAEVLGKSGTDVSCRLLLLVMENTSIPEQLRAECAFNLGASGKEMAIQPLVKLMKTANAPLLLRNACLHGLAASKRREAVPPIIETIQGEADNRQYRRDAASQLLRSLTGMDFGPDKERWTAWYELQKDKPWRSGL